MAIEAGDFVDETLSNRYRHIAGRLSQLPITTLGAMQSGGGGVALKAGFGQSAVNPDDAVEHVTVQTIPGEEMAAVIDQRGPFGCASID